MTPEDSSDLDTLQRRGIELFRDNRPGAPPLMFLLGALSDWFEARHIELIRPQFPEARRAFNPVFIHLPADGCRVTELAAKAEMSKQAMSELVEELIGLGYLARFPDPSDGRAKLILRTEKGLAAHSATLAAFGQLERDLAAGAGAETVAGLRRALELALDALPAA